MNKHTYLANEVIWFKGYITEKKSAAPYGLTANVYVQLLDSNGNHIDSNLHYAENSTFEGYLPLNETLPTGLYFIQAFTNYMNNFNEDESSIFPIEIINPAENKVVERNIKYETAEILLFPESGVFLQGVSNTFGVRIVDCNDNGISVAEAKVIDSKGNLITTFNTNDFGYGKFEILNAVNDIYTVTAIINGTAINKLLPRPLAEGLSFSVNNFALANKTVITVKTNAKTLKKIAGDTYSIILQKADAAAVIDFTADSNKTEYNLIVPSTEISDGLTTMYLIDKNLEKIGERVIYNTAVKSKSSEIKMTRKDSDSIAFGGSTPLKLGSLSITILPYGTSCKSPQKTIYSTFLFDSYLTTATKSLPYFLNDLSRKKHFELDNILLTKTSKYNWNEMIAGNDITITHPFDSGLTVKGTINSGIDDPKDFKIKMSSYSAGTGVTDINDKKEFYFHNLIATDSSTIHFSLLNKRQKTTTLKMYPQLVDNNRRFLKQFHNIEKNCIRLTSDDIDLPEISNAIALENINVETVAKRESLEKTSRYGNSMARGFKITDELAGNYLDVLSFIQAHGYNVSQNGADVTISNRYARSFSGSNSPAVFIDDAPFENFNILRGYSLKDIDEIYINKRGYGMGTNGALGEIRIYTKKAISAVANIAIKSQSLLITNGFQRWKKYENPKYDNVQETGFKKYGTIHWIPNVNTDSDGKFTFSIPNLYQQKVTIILEGISSTGEIISETSVIDIP